MIQSDGSPFIDSVFKSKRLTPEQRGKKYMGPELNKHAHPITQEELDIAKDAYFANGGTVTHLRPNGIAYTEIRNFVKEHFDDQEIINDLSLNNRKKELNIGLTYD